MLLLLLALLLAAFHSAAAPQEPLDLRIPGRTGALGARYQAERRTGAGERLLVEQAGDDLLCTVEHLLVDYPAVQKFYLDPVTLVPRRTDKATTRRGAPPARHLR